MGLLDNIFKKTTLDQINMRLGYSIIEIRIPKDLLNYGND